MCFFYTPTFFVPLENNVVQEVVSNYNISGNLSLFARIGVQPEASNVSRRGVLLQSDNFSVNVVQKMALCARGSARFL